MNETNHINLKRAPAGVCECVQSLHTLMEPTIGTHHASVGPRFCRAALNSERKAYLRRIHWLHYCANSGVEITRISEQPDGQRDRTYSFQESAATLNKPSPPAVSTRINMSLAYLASFFSLNPVSTTEKMERRGVSEFQSASIRFHQFRIFYCFWGSGVLSPQRPTSGDIQLCRHLRFAHPAREYRRYDEHMRSTPRGSSLTTPTSVVQLSS